MNKNSARIAFWFASALVVLACVVVLVESYRAAPRAAADIERVDREVQKKALRAQELRDAEFEDLKASGER